MKKKTLWTSFSGNLKKKENQHGAHHGAMVVQDGILNVQ